MSKIIDSLVQSDIDSKNFAAIILARFHFTVPSPGTLRYCNAYQPIYWDEDGGGEVEYFGLGNLAGLQPISETNELSAQTMQFTLSGIPNNTITGIFNKSAYQNKPVYVWYGLLDKQTFAIRGGQTGPILIFAGLMDYCTFEFGSTATINLTASSRLADWERARGGRYNDPYQRRYVDPYDSGFKYVLPLQAKEIQWGGTTVMDPGGGDWTTLPGPGGGAGGGDSGGRTRQR